MTERKGNVLHRLGDERIACVTKTPSALHKRTSGPRHGRSDNIRRAMESKKKEGTGYTGPWTYRFRCRRPSSQGCDPRVNHGLISVKRPVRTDAPSISQRTTGFKKHGAARLQGSKGSARMHAARQLEADPCTGDEQIFRPFSHPLPSTRLQKNWGRPLAAHRG